MEVGTTEAEDEEVEQDDNAINYSEDLRETCSEIVNILDVDQWVAVNYEGNWYPGCVQKVNKPIF